MLKSLPIGLLVVDPAARIIFLNRYVERTLGYGRDELLGQSADTLVPERLRIQHVDLRQLARVPRERPIGMGIDLCARDGSEIPVEIWLEPIRSEGLDLVLVVLVDISERKRVEERQRLIIGELNHRVQNLFAVVQSMALHSLDGKRSLMDAREVFIDRLQSLGRAYSMMTEQEWRGAALRQILAAETSPFADRVSIDGIDLMVRQNAAQSFALLLHELTTNAVKYGALSVESLCAGRSTGKVILTSSFCTGRRRAGRSWFRRPLPATGERSSKTRCGALASTRSNMRPRAWNFGWKRRSRKSAG
ncbi:MAG: HWE histidine kinase domain-containing protein [Rhodoplanes sp.]